MRSLLAIVPLVGFLIGLTLAPDARAQNQPPEPLCAPGQDCTEAARWGAWGLIFLGIMCFVVWLEPPRRSSEGEESARHRIPTLRVLQRRLERELTGWRRFQWPVLGVFFIAVGVATLAG